MFLCWRVDRFQRHFLWLRFGHWSKKNGDLAKDGKVCQLAVGGYVSAVPLVKVQKGKVKD